MFTYCAFLGHQPHISLAELCVLLRDIKIRKLWNPHIVTFETASVLDSTWLRSVGGTVLLARELTSIPAVKGEKRMKNDDTMTLERLVHPLLQKELAGGDKRKVTFSLRCFGIARQTIRALYRSSKVSLRAKGIPSRYIGNERHPAQPGTLMLRGIPGPGTCELVILRDEQSGDLWVGATCAVQDIEAYTERDMGKPFRDTRTGILPPKLAQVMLNLGLLLLNVRPNQSPGSKAKDQESKQRKEHSWENTTVWDPFCGSGVIVLEALLRRAHVLASDRSERAVKGCEENIRWLRGREKTPKAIIHSTFQHNAWKPCVLPHQPTLIVTETSLGPALRQPPTKAEIRQLVRSAEELESKFFTALLSACPCSPVVATFPVYVARDGERTFLPTILTTLATLGYRLTFPGNKALRMTDRHTLLYLRPDQHVGREIVCLLAPRNSEKQREAELSVRSEGKKHVKSKKR